VESRPRASRLRTSELFADLNDEEFLQLMRIARIREMRAGDLVFDVNDPGDAMYVIEEGNVRTMQVMPDGSREILVNLGPGQVFGEMAMIDREPRAARALAVTAVRLLQIDRSAFQALKRCGSSATCKVQRALAQLLARRLRETNGQIERFFTDAENSMQYLQSRMKGR